jgi:hypothetical protein
VGAIFVFKDLEGISSGIITFWRQDVFQVSDSFVGNNYMVIRGCVSQNIEAYIFNIYVPCEANGRRAQCEEILSLFEGTKEVSWCFTRDFNEVRDSSKRRGGNSYDRGF